MSFPPRGKSEIIFIINSVMKLMSCNVMTVMGEKRWSRYLGDGAWIGREMSFSLRGNSEIIFIINSDMKLMSCPNSCITSKFFT